MTASLNWASRRSARSARRSECYLPRHRQAHPLDTHPQARSDLGLAARIQTGIRLAIVAALIATPGYAEDKSTEPLTVTITDGGVPFQGASVRPPPTRSCQHRPMDIRA